MKAQQMQKVVESTSLRLSQKKINELNERIRKSKPPDLVTPERINLREIRLAEAEIRPSPTALERILGKNDLVDVNYLIKAANAAKSVCRIILRDRAGREIGYGTAFKVAPSLLMTNHHVLKDDIDAETALAEFDHELDESGSPKSTTRFELDPRGFFLSDQELDFALVAISPDPKFGQGRLENYGFLRLMGEIGKINPGEFVSIIQHPSGQPKQIALRENKLLAIEELVLWYQSDTAQGSSGAPVFNDSWQIVALHHSGVPKKDNKGNWLLKNGKPAGPDAEDGDIDWDANEGIRVSRIVKFIETNAKRGCHLDDFMKVTVGELKPAISSPDYRYDQPYLTAISGITTDNLPGGARVTLPVTFTISFGGSTPLSPSKGKAEQIRKSYDLGLELMKVPVVDRNYRNRKGYDKNFLEMELPIPIPKNKNQVAKMENDNYEIPYEHFTVVMDKERRFALFTASNVDARIEKKRPEMGKDYSRDGLGGFGPNDTEMWLIDPRIPESQQLPDRFYTKDEGAFDKGHLVRRDDVCWGENYEEVRRANGDTYHTTNCSPQVADFNRSSRGGIWGKLENNILRQAKTEKYSVFSGPVLKNSDREFTGKDNVGEVRIQIPSMYWKIVVARAVNKLQAFAFLLKQDLTGIPLEFAVDAEWENYMISIKVLEKLLNNIRFSDILKKVDQFETKVGKELLKVEELIGLNRDFKESY